MKLPKMPLCAKCRTPLDSFTALARGRCANCGVDFYDLTILVNGLVDACARWIAAEDYAISLVRLGLHPSLLEYQDVWKQVKEATELEVVPARAALRAALKTLQEVQNASRDLPAQNAG